jgi:hypothetical protein
MMTSVATYLLVVQARETVELGLLRAKVRAAPPCPALPRTIPNALHVWVA